VQGLRRGHQLEAELRDALVLPIVIERTSDFPHSSEAMVTVQIALTGIGGPSSG